MRLGVYGGAFDPPHVGHFNAAKAFIEQLSLDKLLVIPTFLPPHKTLSGRLDANKRLELSRLAFGELPRAEVSDMEISYGGTSYTYLTLERLASQENELFLLIGTDQLLSFDSWNSFERIFELATVCVVRREEDPTLGALLEKKIEELRCNYSARIVPVPVSVTEISSSEIRKSIGEGNIPKRFLNESVAFIIESEGLYR